MHCGAPLREFGGRTSTRSSVALVGGSRRPLRRSEDYCRSRPGRGEGSRLASAEARWRGHLDQCYRGPRSFRAATTPPSLSLKFRLSLATYVRGMPSGLSVSILCWARSGEGASARDRRSIFRAKVWTIPGERMKGGRGHRVPLTPRAIETQKPPRPSPMEDVFPDRGETSRRWRSRCCCGGWIGTHTAPRLP